MSAVSYDTPEHDWNQTESEAFTPPGRPRRRLFNRKSAALAALITCAAGFYAGIRVEKSQLATTTSAATTGAAGGVTGAGAAAGGFAARFGGGAAGTGGGLGGGAAGGNASIGTVASVNGNTIYLTDTSGNTVKVTLSPSSKLTKSLPVSKSSVHPGDAVVVQGVKNSSGTIVATSVSDSGASAARGGGITSGSSASGSTAAGGSSTTG